MKKILAAALALALVFLTGACGQFVSIMPGTEIERPVVMSGGADDPGAAFEERSVLDFLGRQAFAESYYSDTPAALSYQRDTANGERGCRSYVFDRATIIAACDALRDMTVVDRAAAEPIRKIDYILTMAGGDEYEFNMGVLEDGTRVLSSYTGDYIVSGGDGLWDISFPAYSQDFDVFDLYFSDSVRTFADGFYENLPVSVGYRMNSGATITSTSPEAVRAAYEALADMTVIVVENQPDQNVDLTQVRDYIFTMEDGSYYTFSFAQRCLSVTANQSFGPVYYWLNGVDALWNVEIASENQNGKFEGGPVADLREDIRRAADAVTAEDSELSVLGVFVEYDVDGQSGYLTLDGDTAEEFIRAVCEVNASGETEASPEGDKITVSVTLSDSSGPILYFTGDAIQQVVGINYVCDGGDMSSLRNRVLDLAAGGNNTAAVEEGGTD